MFSFEINNNRLIIMIILLLYFFLIKTVKFFITEYDKKLLF
jgi:hypothetical protein